MTGCAMSGLPWETPLLFVFSPSFPSNLGLSCVPLCPCCMVLMYLHGSAFSYGEWPWNFAIDAVKCFGHGDMYELGGFSLLYVACDL